MKYYFKCKLFNIALIVCILVASVFLPSCTVITKNHTSSPTTACTITNKHILDNVCLLIELKQHTTMVSLIGNYKYYEIGVIPLKDVYKDTMYDKSFYNKFDNIANLATVNYGVTPVYIATNTITKTENKHDDKQNKNVTVLVKNISMVNNEFYYTRLKEKSIIYNNRPNHIYKYFLDINVERKRPFNGLSAIGVLTLGVIPFKDIHETNYTISIYNNERENIHALTNKYIIEEFVWLPFMFTFGAFSYDQNSDIHKRKELEIINDLICKSLTYLKDIYQSNNRL